MTTTPTEFTGRTKLLVTTGWHEGSKKIEVLDLSNPTNVCQPSVLDDYPIDLVKSSVGCLVNHITLICGGSYTKPDTVRLDDCFAITGDAVEANVSLSESRYNAASVVLNGDTLWVTGGLIGSIIVQSTEFVQLNGTKPGPDLPQGVSYHSLVSLNDTTVLLIGGYLADKTYSKATFYYNTDNQTWTEGPSLITERSIHLCALFKTPLHGYTDCDCHWWLQ
jgi:hypothetical protein